MKPKNACGDVADDALLTTERLTLRRPRMTDAGDMARLLGNLRVAEMTARIPHPYVPEDARAFIERNAAEPRGRGAYAMIRTADGVFLGCCGVHDRDRPDATEAPAPEIGYWLGQPYWGNGYATEAARALVAATFADISLARINASCRTVNPASRRVLEKCGFRFHGTAMSICVALGHDVEVALCRLDRADWEARAGAV